MPSAPVPSPPCHHLGGRLPIERFLSTIDIYGNTSTASIPLTLDHSLRQGNIKPGDKVLMLGFGSGFTWGGALVHFQGPAL